MNIKEKTNSTFKTLKLLKKATKDRGVRDVAAAVGLHPGTIYNQQNGVSPYEPCGKTPNIVDSFIRLNEACENNILLEYVSQFFGQIIIANPTVNAQSTPAMRQISKMLQQFSSFIDEIGAANEDSIITQAESETIRLHWECLKRRCEEFVISAENGRFSP